MNSTDRPVANPDVELREESDGWAVLFHRGTGASVGINPVGAAVWKLLDGRCSLEEIAALIRDEFSGVPGTAPGETGDFVGQLIDLGFVDGQVGRHRGMTGHAEDVVVLDTPRKAEVLITSRCNLSCRYCAFFGDPSVEYRDLPAREWLAFFEELGRCGVKMVMLSGGEPFIREDLPQLLDGIVANGMRFGIGSNGGLIGDAIAAQIAATGRCDYVQVSVDGSCPETHDVFRGPGSFEGAIRGIGILQRHGVNATAYMAIHRRNVRDLEATARLLLEELRVPLLAMTSAYTYGRGRLNAEEVLLTATEREEAMATLLRLDEKYNGRVVVDPGSLAWRLMEGARLQGLPAFPDGGRLTGCRCMDRKYMVLSDGTIVPCFRLTNMPLGRINRETLEEVWRHSPLLERLRRRRTIPLTDFAFCAGCGYVPYCTGNCPASACEQTGQLDHPSPVHCLRRYLAEGGRLP